MKLFTPKKDVRREAYCGPVAIMATTGKPLSRVLASINAVRRKDPSTPVTGLGITDLRRAVRHLGYRTVQLPIGDEGSLTLAQFWKTMPRGTRVVACSRRHWVSLTRTELCDTKTKVPVPWRGAPQKRIRVQDAFAVVRDTSIQGRAR